MSNANQTPEQAARDIIDKKLSQAGWVAQDKNKIDFSVGIGIAVREYQTDVGSADYVLFIDKKPVGVIEGKPKYWGRRSRRSRNNPVIMPPPSSSGLKITNLCLSFMKVPAC